MPHLTPAQIRTLAPEALTHLAWEVGLAPDGTGVWGDDWIYDFTQREDWEPATNLVQADAVFRRLRARGWVTDIWWHPLGEYGMVFTGLSTDMTWKTKWLVGWGKRRERQDVYAWAPSEAHALLLCAVLAVASEQEA